MTRFVSNSTAHICALALFAMIASIGCSPQANTNVNANSSLATPSPATVNCAAVSTTNEDIVKAIYAAIATSSYSKEVDQFNITASKPNVKIIGWSTNRTDIIAIAKSVATGCNVPTNDPDFADSKSTLGANYQQRLGCPPGHGPCGDICIPVGEPCNVTSRPAGEPSWNCVPAGSPSPSPTANKAP